MVYMQTDPGWREAGEKICEGWDPMVCTLGLTEMRKPSKPARRLKNYNAKK
jgi:hypothetical protein